MGNRTMEKEILDYVQLHPEGTWSEKIARELNHSRQTVGRYIGQLEADGKVRIAIEGQMKRVYPIPPDTPRKKVAPVSTRNGGVGVG
jgi:DNA-binding transcriptional regulator LsrR (DeoR family)